MEAGKYKVFRNNNLVGEKTAEEAATMIVCSAYTVRSYANTCRDLYGVYRFERVKAKKKGLIKPKTMTLDLEAEWERTRQQLLHSGYDLSTIQITRPEGRKLYMQVTADRLSLPTAIADSAIELETMTSCKSRTIISTISRGKSGARKQPKFVAVKNEEIDDDR